METATGGEPRTFSALGITPGILAVLAERGITVPTPIQHSSIPTALAGKDIFGIAQTGTGKTYAFGLPLLQRLSQEAGRALIILPTRELADQVEEALTPVAKALGIGVAVFIGGASMHLQRMALKKNPRVLVATPGRLLDHLQQKTVTLREVSMLVLDEADRMLDMGFAPQLRDILRHVPAERQTMLFSATMPQDIVSMATQYMRTPIRIEVAPPGRTAEKVEQAMMVLYRDEKPFMLQKLLQDYTGTVLVFTRTKHGAKKLTSQLVKAGHKAAEIHANRTLSQRRSALEGFKSGKHRVLVATDIAARGIDVADIELVVNFDLPGTPEEYVHRIGRTGRAGKQGQAVTFVTPEQRGEIRRIERLIEQTLEVADLTVGTPRPAAQAEERPRQGFSRGRRGRPMRRLRA